MAPFYLLALCCLWTWWTASWLLWWYELPEPKFVPPGVLLWFPWELEPRASCYRRLSQNGNFSLYGNFSLSI